MDLGHCPACKADTLGTFAWLASWPFHASCPACKARVRRQHHLWLGLVCEPVGFLVIVLSVILAKSVALVAIGVAAGFLVLLVPALTGRFVVTPEKRLAS